jgi:hypothetical protein
MNERLRELLSIPGVISVLAVNNRAEIIASVNNGKYDVNVSTRMAARVVKIFAIGIYGKIKRPAKEMELLFDSLRVLAIDGGMYNMIIFSSIDAQMSLLRMSVNVLMNIMNNDKRVQTFLEKHRIDKKILLRKDKLSEDEIKLLERI